MYMIHGLIESTLSNIRAFCCAYEDGSFTAAAKSLRVTPAAVSRAIARLEHSLGVTLFRRTTRQLRPTDHGVAYYAQCQAALALLVKAERDLAETTGVRGVVRISVPTTYGAHHLLPHLDEVRTHHPHIELEVHVSNQNVDFVREGFDLAVRMGPLEGAHLVARKLGDFRLGVFASPRYVAAHGTPKRVEDLEDDERHTCIGFLMPRTGRALPWLFSSPSCELRPAFKLRCVEDPRAAVALARIGAGLVQTYLFMVEQDLARGDLVEVLEPYAGRTRRFSIVYPKQPAPTRAAKVVIEAALGGAHR
jgi:DNA-binding transcriptional LysR family regulator